ncbi:MAG: D-alanine--D-alanine ligase [Eubacteriales bacterium]|nr:D-alanine--D-alanine ligase [Eubacteriales bacterium]
MIRLGIIFGGRSGEHEVSLMSSTSAIKAIDKSKFDIVMIGITKDGRWKLFEGEPDDVENGKWESLSEEIKISDLKGLIDFAFPILHGTYGEDGTIQGLFEMLDIPYSGCGVLASACAMDKIVAKNLFDKAGILGSDYISTTEESFKNEDVDRICAALSFPVFVKPANMGSSIGIIKVARKEELEEAILEAFKYDSRVIIEKGINARELEVGVIGNHKLILSEVGEIVPSAEYYDYTAKYFDGGKSRMIVPAQIKPETREKALELAAASYRALDCAGFARCDFLLDKETEDVYINEINTIPGLTKFSMFPILFQEAGVPYGTLIERIVEFGYERYYSKNNRKAN